MASPTLLYGRRHQKGLNWITAIAMAGFHVGAVAALFFIDYGAMLAALILYVVAGMLGIGMAYHRLLTHRGYKTYKWVEYTLTWCATLALEGGPIFWVATHRIHHQHSDMKGIRTRRARARGGRTRGGSSWATGCITTRPCSRATCPI